MNEFLFNVSFTRPDEDNANAYVVGFRVQAETRDEAERGARVTLGHLTITSIELYAMFDKNGEEFCAACQQHLPCSCDDMAQDRKEAK